MVEFMQPWKKMPLCFLILVSSLQMVSSVSSYEFSQKTIDTYDYCGWNIKNKNSCPLFNDNFWECLRGEFDCPTGTDYHCARLFDDKTKFIDSCAPKKTCHQGEAPYLIKEKNGKPTEDFYITCDWCYVDTFNSVDRLSSTYSECMYKIKCDPQHGMECVPENIYDTYKQDRLCRCDSRGNYVPSDISKLNGKICTSDSSIISFCEKKDPCRETEERLLNYTCAEKCENGYRSENSDDCISSSQQGDPQSTDEPSVTENLNNITEKTTAITTKTTTTTIKKTVISAGNTTSATPTTYGLVIKHVHNYTIAVVVGIVAFILLIVVFVVAVIKCKKCWKKKRVRQSEGDGDEPLLGKANFEVVIHVTSEEYTLEIERARPNVSRLDIAKRLQDALKNELSSITGVKDVIVTDIRSGSLIVVFLIETERLQSEKSLKHSLSQILKKRKCGEFTVDPKGFRFRKYPALAPIPRRPSVIETDVSSPSQRRSRVRRAYSLPTSFPNGHAAYWHAPLASPIDEFEGFLEVSETEEESHVEFTLSSPSSPEQPTTAFWFPGTHQQPLVGTRRSVYNNIPEPTVQETIQRQQLSQLSSSRCSEDGLERRASQHVQMRRVSSSLRDLDSATEYRPPPLKPYQSQCSMDEEIRDDAAKQTLDKYLEDLLKYVQPDAILDQFAKDDFMRDIDIRDIREQDTTTKKIRKIIDAVKHKGYKGFQKLMKIMRSNQLDLGKVETDFNRSFEEKREKYQAENDTDHYTDDSNSDADVVRDFSV